MDNIDKRFDQCPVCGSTERFLESLANEVKERGLAREEWTFHFDSRDGVVIDQVTEGSIPIGSTLPGFNIRTDICSDCGCIYAIAIGSSPAKKSVAPPPPDGVPGPRPPLHSPWMNDPRFS